VGPYAQNLQNKHGWRHNRAVSICEDCFFGWLCILEISGFGVLG
jgi:hypothetical protein